LLLLTIAGLGTVVVFELTRDVAIAPEVTAAAPTSAAEASTDGMKFAPPPERQFGEISDRPLFSPSRRPFVPPVAPVSHSASTDEPSAKIELLGVILTKRERAALVQPGGQNVAYWVHEQQTVAGWLIEEIAADRIRVRDRDRLEVVKLRADQARPTQSPSTSGHQPTGGGASSP
jgi:hypothetical protein